MKYEQINETLFCRFDAEMDTITCTKIADELATQIKTALQEKSDLKIVFDLSETTYIASSFLRFCVQYYKMVGAGRLTVTHASDNIKEVFEIAALTEILSLN
ncbi:MAG: STAS domain-containing protein [Planctomycetaceae bacterium]|jgi:anti-anti-sigma factor|nr:STAS domain-containing protein [Planctomycetaceae bacterium]